jgi:hypothetical protein
MASICICGRFNRSLRGLSLALMTALVAAVGQSAWAVVPTTGFTLDLSPSPRVLDALDMKRDGVISSSQFYDIKYDEACDNPHLRIRARNKPAVMLTNADSSPSALASFMLTINEGPYIFGMGDVVGDNFANFIKNTIYTDPGVSITSSSVSADMKILTVNFDGLTPGKLAIFNIDLDTTDVNGFVYPDYRMVLFGAPQDGEDPTTPATAKVTYVSGPALPEVSFALACDLHGNLIDYSETPEFANENIRPYADMDKMEIATIGVPEPSAAALVLAAVAAFAVRFRR